MEVDEIEFHVASEKKNTSFFFVGQLILKNIFHIVINKTSLNIKKNWVAVPVRLRSLQPTSQRLGTSWKSAELSSLHHQKPSNISMVVSGSRNRWDR